jgi:hypothetical protein
LRSTLLDNILARYPNAEVDIMQHRRKILLGRQLIDENYRGDTREWTFVGLAQRSSRRSWINIRKVSEACDATFLRNTIHQRNVLCLEVNVEKSKSPQEQLIIHRALDAMIGIHGAQLTQAILLRSNAHVLELLPWVPVSLVCVEAHILSCVKTLLLPTFTNKCSGYANPGICTRTLDQDNYTSNTCRNDIP